MDEKGVLMGVGSRVKVICLRGRKSPPLIHGKFTTLFVLTLLKKPDGNRKTITILETISADGTVLPPMIIYKGIAQYKGWYQHLSIEDDDTIFCRSDKGWTNQILGVEYLKFLFNVQTAKRCYNQTETRLLIVDGHNSHFSNEFIDYCDDNNIQLFCLPPHSTHVLQPLDVGLFGPLQTYYSKGVEEHMRLGQESINKATFLP